MPTGCARSAESQTFVCGAEPGTDRDAADVGKTGADEFYCQPFASFNDDVVPELIYPHSRPNVVST